VHEPARPLLDLGGIWRARAAEADLAKEFPAPGHVDEHWPEVVVPGHWRSAKALATSDGPVLYRRHFELAPVAGPRRRTLELDGVFYYGDVWLDGEYLGATEGYFVPHAFEVTSQLATGGEHVLAIEVASPAPRSPGSRRTVGGVFSHGDGLDPEWNPGGIWRPLRVVETGPARVARLRCLCTEATADHGRLQVDLTVDTDRAGDETLPAARIEVTCTGPDGTVLAVAEREVTLAAGDNHLVVPLDVAQPPRWWPWRLGDQPTCRVDVLVLVDGEPSDRRTLTTAFRDVRVDRWTFSVNGERLYVMGGNHGPTRADLAAATADEVARDVVLAREANLDLLRVRAHVARPELYAAADAAGMLLWQDLPLQWAYAHGIRRQAVRQARAIVDLLGHHPSVALWCAHDEPFPRDHPRGAASAPGRRLRTGTSIALPTWTKDVLDRSIARALRRADPTRPVDPHSGVPGEPTGRGGDAHVFYGWERGHMADLAPRLRAVPRLARFVSEFGAAAVPTTEAWLRPERWPNLDWPRLADHHGLARAAFDRYVPPADHVTFASWRDATQAYQAALVQLQVEDLRRLKHRPGGGFCHFFLADAHPAVSAALLDHERVPKRGYAALRDACRPVLGMLEPRRGLVHVVSERHDTLEDAVVEVRVGTTTRRFAGAVAADAVTFVGRVDVGGTDRATVTVEHPALGTVVNEYGPVLLGACRA